MPAADVVRARIDTATKVEATRVLAEIGLSVSDAIRLLLVKIAAERALPFELHVPNKVTVAAIDAARRGEVERFDTVAALLAAADASDD